MSSSAPRAAEPPPAARGSRGSAAEVWAWCFYDWAQSAYSTLQITIVVFYLTKVVWPGNGGAYLYSYGISATMLCTALLSPVVGALADAHASKRRWLWITTAPSVAAALGMALVPDNQTLLIAALFIVMNLGYELSQGIYNAFLTEIVDDDQVDRISARGFAVGYVGGGVALMIALAAMFDWSGFEWSSPSLPPAVSAEAAPGRMRFGLGLLGVWWGLFSLPALLMLKDRSPPRAVGQGVLDAAGSAFRQVASTLGKVRRYRTLFLFLAAFLIYNDGIQTIINQASLFADRALHVQEDQLISVILMIQFLALPGALFVGWLSGWWGQKPTLLACLVIYMLWLCAAYFITTFAHLLAMGAVLALVMGGSQSVSRAMMARLTPPQHAGEFFGFFSFAAKATSMLGPALFVTVLNQAGNPYWAILSLLVFFIVGAALLAPVNVERGRREAAAAEAAAR